MRILTAGLLAAGLVAAGAAQGADMTLKTYTSADPILSLGQAAFDGGKTLNLSVGVGSGAYRRADAPANVFVSVSDRGPNIACADAKAVLGVEGKDFCKASPGGRIYPRPNYAPSIYRIRLNDDGTFSVFDQIAIKDKDGNPVSGLLNPLTIASTETPLDGKGNILAQSADAVDAEGIVELADGTFWIGDENGPSIMHVAADGRILMRLVPQGSEQDYAKANYAVIGSLPSILTKRVTNRGIESMALSPDEKFLYFIIQNPLGNPDTATYAKAKNTRLYKMDRVSLKIVGEYVYTLDDPMTFRLDPSDKQNAPRISELLALGGDRLVVLERTDATTKLYEIVLAGASDILGSPWDKLATSPSLEASDAAKAEIAVVKKTLRFDSADHPEVPAKVEGLAILGDGALMMINDDDFGITGERTKVLVVTGTGIRMSADH